MNFANLEKTYIISLLILSFLLLLFFPFFLSTFMFDKFIKLLLVFEDVLETSKINAVNGGRGRGVHPTSPPY